MSKPLQRRAKSNPETDNSLVVYSETFVSGTSDTTDGFGQAPPAAVNDHFGLKKAKDDNVLKRICESPISCFEAHASCRQFF